MGSPNEARTILVIVICPSIWLRVVSLSNHLLFEICDLEFLVTSTDCLKGERLLKPPHGAVQGRVLRVQVLYYKEPPLARANNQWGSELKVGTKQGGFVPSIS
jgi:hypothetical protein